MPLDVGPLDTGADAAHDLLEKRREGGLARREKTRHKLIDAAARLVAERGHAKCTIDDYIQAAGVSRGTFYNYFATGDELLAALWEKVGDDPLVHIPKACEHLTDVAERLVAHARLVFDSARKNPAWAWLVFDLASDFEESLAYPKADLIIGQRSGRFRFESLAAACDLTRGSLRTGMHGILTEGRPEGFVRALCAMLLMSLGITEDEAVEIVNRPLPHVE